MRLDPPGTEPVGAGRFGDFGGRYVPETLVPALEQLEDAFRTAWTDDGFRSELVAVGRERARSLSPASTASRLVGAYRLALGSG